MLRNKIAEITRFVPTSLLVRRGAAGSTAGTGVNDSTTPNTTTSSVTTSLSSSDSHYYYNHQPYDYMSQQQQTYSNMNPLMSGSSSSTARPKTSDNYGLEQQKPTTTKLASTDAAYESFMKEIGKLL